MKTPRVKVESAAYTRADLVVTIGVVSCLAAMAWPAVGVSAGRSARVLCMNNLRQIGQAFQIWSHDHSLYVPWQVSASEGGNYLSTLAGKAWYQYSWISNQLSSPRVLVCPQDATRVPAMNWGLGAGGLLNSSCRNNCISYPLELHANSLAQDSVLSADPNIRYSRMRNCPLIYSGFTWQPVKTDPNVGWTNAVHGLTGNLLLDDGRVLEASSERLRSAIPDEVYEEYHFLVP